MKLVYERDERTYSFEPHFSDEVTPDVFKGSMLALGTAWNVPPQTVEYWINYGFRKSLQDATAGTEKKVRASLKEEADAVGEELDELEVVNAVADAIREELDFRMQQFVDGDLIAGQGATKNPFRTKCREFAIKGLKASCKRQNKALPDVKTAKGKEEFEKLVQVFWLNNAKKIEAAVTRALEAEAEIMEE